MTENDFVASIDALMSVTNNKNIVRSLGNDLANQIERLGAHVLSFVNNNRGVHPSNRVMLE